MPIGSMHSIGPIAIQAAYKWYNMCQARKRKYFHVERTGRRDEGSTRTCNELNKLEIRQKLRLLPWDIRIRQHIIVDPSIYFLSPTLWHSKEHLR